MEVELLLRLAIPPQAFETGLVMRSPMYDWPDRGQASAVRHVLGVRIWNCAVPIERGGGMGSTLGRLLVGSALRVVSRPVSSSASRQSRSWDDSLSTAVERVRHG